MVSRPKWFLAGKPCRISFHKKLFAHSRQQPNILLFWLCIHCCFVLEVAVESATITKKDFSGRGGGHYNRQRESALQQYQVLVLSTNSSE